MLKETKNVEDLCDLLFPLNLGLPFELLTIMIIYFINVCDFQKYCLQMIMFKKITLATITAPNNILNGDYYVLQTLFPFQQFP